MPDEPGLVKHVRGIVSMARPEETNSATTHFFILVGDGHHLDGKFSAFGRVTKGIEVADAINKAPSEGEKPNKPVRINRAMVAPCKKVNTRLKSLTRHCNTKRQSLLIGLCLVTLAVVPYSRGDKPTPDAAKRFLKLRGYEFNEKSFLAAAAANDLTAVNAFLAAGINPECKRRSERSDRTDFCRCA